MESGPVIRRRGPADEMRYLAKRLHPGDGAPRPADAIILGAAVALEVLAGELEASAAHHPALALPQASGAPFALLADVGGAAHLELFLPCGCVARYDRQTRNLLAVTARCGDPEHAS